MGDNTGDGSEFASRLKALREQAGLSQGQLAERAGMNMFSIAKLEQGRREPSWATVLALAAALGVDCTAFLPTAAKPAATPANPMKAAAPANPMKAAAKPAAKRRGKRQ